MGKFKAIGRVVKRLPWRKIAKYGGAAVGLPVLYTASGATDDLAVPLGDLMSDPESWLTLAQSVIGALLVFLRDLKRSRRSDEQTAE